MTAFIIAAAVYLTIALISDILLNQPTKKG